MDSTQWAGLLSFGGAAAACAAARIPGWGLVAALNAAFAAECALGWRHGLHNAAIALIGEAYRQRMPLQLALTLAVLIAAIALLLWGGCRYRRSWTIAAWTTGCTLLLFAVETISLHGIDRILYHGAGPLLVIGWLWILLGTATAAGAVVQKSGRS